MGQVANDAVNWKVNFPIYDTKLAKMTEFATSLTMSLDDCDKQREAQGKLLVVTEEQKERWRLYGEEKDKESNYALEQEIRKEAPEVLVDNWEDFNGPATLTKSEESPKTQEELHHV